MAETIEYDEAEARHEELIYETGEAADRRRFVREALDLEGDERVLSIGCGPGFEPAELAPIVDGEVVGVDRSEAMLALASRRCNDSPNVTLTTGDATDLPIADESADAATVVQVYQYVDDLEAAIDELARVLRPGGRAMVYHTDWDSLVWRSTNRARAKRVLEAFFEHCPRPHLGSELAEPLREGGLVVDRVEPNCLLDTRLEEGTFAYHLMEGVAKYVVDRDAVDPDMAEAWIEDLRALEATGGTFFSLTQYGYLVRSPA
ncbi:methyltransferase domain-containing protein [Natrarchaeobius sp. A-rgal3]|uniref:methyltransferase domain-containing protein n=1 Tax=Natrarchaeobius versutus TaxID=1679078 RepID=UPI00350F302B